MTDPDHYQQQEEHLFQQWEQAMESKPVNLENAAQKAQGLALLRVPFDKKHISKLPKPTISNDEWKKLPKAKCSECGGYHATSKTIHLDYVGHAALTDRLLDADPNWNWEPVSWFEDGQPKLDANGGMWIKLTVCGVTRLGYGDAQGKTGPNAVKERIGDALRNAAMRFGAALELWHKVELHADDEIPAGPLTETIKPASGALESLTVYQQTVIGDIFTEVGALFLQKGPLAAIVRLELLTERLSVEEKTALWDKFPSTSRTAMKKAKREAKKAAEDAAIKRVIDAAKPSVANQI